MQNPVKFSDVKAGDILVADGGFDCLQSGTAVKVYADDGLRENMHVSCNHGKHFLSGQIGSDGFLVGLGRQ